VLPREIRADFLAAVSDPELISLRGELALLATRITGLARQLGDVLPPDWTGMRREIESLRIAWTVPQRDLTAIGQRIEAVLQLANAGLDCDRAQQRAWTEMRRLIQERARIATAEARRVAETQQSIRKEQAVALFAYLGNSIKTHVLDPDLYAKGPRAILVAIQGDIDKAIIIDAEPITEPEFEHPGDEAVGGTTALAVGED
jgi:hypothetical protein